MTDEPTRSEDAGDADSARVEAVSGAAPSEGCDAAFSVVFTPPAAPRRRLRYERRADGPGWWRYEDQWTGCTWRRVGRELVEDVALAIRTGDGDGDDDRGGAATTFRGP